MFSLCFGAGSSCYWLERSGSNDGVFWGTQTAAVPALGRRRSERAAQSLLKLLSDMQGGVVPSEHAGARLELTITIHPSRSHQRRRLMKCGSLGFYVSDIVHTLAVQSAGTGRVSLGGLLLTRGVQGTFLKALTRAAPSPSLQPFASARAQSRCSKDGQRAAPVGSSFSDAVMLKHAVPAGRLPKSRHAGSTSANSPSCDYTSSLNTSIQAYSRLHTSRLQTRAACGPPAGRHCSHS